jgi:hypothetical protein
VRTYLYPLLTDYKVGVVMPKAGINDAQLGEMSRRLDLIGKALSEEGRIHVYVPGFNFADAEASVVRNVRNMLERKARAHITYIPCGGDHKAGVANLIVYELAEAKRCDEIWCFPAEGQRGSAAARVAQVWRLGQAHARHTTFKQIPPWVEAPPPPEAPGKATKGKSWRDMWSKRSFR